MDDWTSIRDGSGAGLTPRWKGWRAGAFLASILGAACLAQVGSGPRSNNGEFRPEKDTAITPVNVRPDANRIGEINRRQVQSQQFAAANMERKRQMAEDSARLLQVATELNEQLAQTSDKVLPPSAMVRAGMIEQLAHAVKEKMRLTVAVR